MNIYLTIALTIFVIVHVFIALVIGLVYLSQHFSGWIVGEVTLLALIGLTTYLSYYFDEPTRTRSNRERGAWRNKMVRGHDK